MGEWRKMHNEELHNLYSSPDIILHGSTTQKTALNIILAAVRT
jgi:hypothetical protein